MDHRSPFTEALQFWDYCDGLELLEAEASKLSEAQVRRIAGLYGLPRSIPGFPAHLEYITATVNSLGREARDLDLVPRAERTLEVAEGMLRGGLESRPLSGLSKWTWFVAPRGWTMFDSYASKPLGSPDFVEFYRRLAAAGFDATVATLRELLKRHGFDGRLAERVVDFALLIEGGSPARDPHTVIRFRGDGRALERLADDAAPVLTSFLASARTRRRRRRLHPR